jgi:NAD/NADP transhydrogenase alpha subunit
VERDARPAHAADGRDQRHFLRDHRRSLLAAAAHGGTGEAATGSVWISKGAGAIAAAFAAVNIFGGFLVTNRMLAMYKKKDKAK